MSFDQRLYLLAITLVALAHHAAGVRRHLRPVAWLLSAGLAIDLVRRACRVWVLEPAAASLGAAPLSGAPRVVGHLSQGLFLAWGAGVLATCWKVFADRWWKAAVGIWGLVWGVAVIGYPTIRGGVLAQVYRGWVILVVGLSAVAVGVFVKKRSRPRQEHAAALWILAIEAALLLGPYLSSDPYRTWWTAKVAVAAMYIGLIPIFLWGSLWKAPTSPS